MPTTRHLCPLPDCGWFYDDRGLTPSDTRGVEPAPDAVTLPDAISSVVGQSTLRHAARIEALVEAHVTTHTTLEWMTEVNRLQGILHRITEEPPC